ncbi:hypothetical protein BC941DRAFT_470350 [Chlamydoabsidia padenii]|nr:hypothetical protein BC941DRAFT_470350 [Chlamydoabsidia padenii]
MSDSMNLETNFMGPDLALFDKQPNSSTSSMFMKRTSVSKAEKRAEHNAIERARRENLNGKFQQLAESLPNLQNYRRPSKGQIVEKALDWVRQSVNKEDRYQYQILQLQNENRQLIMQLNLRQQESKLVSPQMIGTCDIPMHPSSSSQPSYHHQPYQYQMMNQQQHQTPSQPQDKNTTTTTTTSMTPLAPQLTSSPYSIATDSRRTSSFMDDEDDRGDLSSMDNYSFTAMMPTHSSNMCFYTGLPTFSLPSPMDPTCWDKLGASTTSTLIHPTDVSSS